MSDKNELDAEMERAAAELEKKKAELPARQAIRNRLAVWTQKDVLHQAEYKRILSDCKHPEDEYTPPRSNNGDAHRYCKDCCRHVNISTDFGW